WWSMTESFHRACKCGAIYRRTESMASGREINSFQCDVCGETLESWNTAWVPNYWLVAGPVRPPEDSHKHTYSSDPAHHRKGLVQAPQHPLDHQCLRRCQL